MNRRVSSRPATSFGESIAGAGIIPFFVFFSNPLLAIAATALGAAAGYTLTKNVLRSEKQETNMLMAAFASIGVLMAPTVLPPEVKENFQKLFPQDSAAITTPDVRPRQQNALPFAAPPKLAARGHNL